MDNEPPAQNLIAITHVPSPRLQAGERTYAGRDAIDFGLALIQHAAYEDRLRWCGARVVQLEVNRELPDCVFVEDTAIVLDEVAVMMSMGADSRRGEPAGIEQELRKYLCANKGFLRNPGLFRPESCENPGRWDLNRDDRTPGDAPVRAVRMDAVAALPARAA